MLKSHVIEAQGVFVGAAVPQGSGFRFVATHVKTRRLDGSIWPTLEDVRRVARTFYQTGLMPRTATQQVAFRPRPTTAAIRDGAGFRG